MFRVIADRNGIIEQFIEAITETRHLSDASHYNAILLRRKIQNANKLSLQSSMKQVVILS